MSRLFVIALLFCAVTTAMAYTTDSLPPPEGAYAATSDIIFANGMRDFTMSGFTGSIAPPGLLVTVSHSFGTTLNMDISTDAGYTWMSTSGSGPGWMSTKHTQDIGNTRYFDEEMTGLSATIFSPTLFLRESQCRSKRDVQSSGRSRAAADF